MGFSLSWLAVKGKPPAEIHGELQLRSTGTRGFEGDSPFVGGASDSGWYLIVMAGAEHPLLRSDVVARLSAGCEVLTCTVEEHVMFSQATGWKDGRRLWMVTHDAAKTGPVGIEEEGTPPPEYSAIRDRLTQAQQADGGAGADVDHMFDIPVVLVQTFVGYKHDEPTSEFEEGGLEVLESETAGSEKQSWLGRMFGKSR